jgi:hypothetical protein
MAGNPEEGQGPQRAVAPMMMMMMNNLNTPRPLPYTSNGAIIHNHYSSRQISFASEIVSSKFEKQTRDGSIP